MNRHQRKPILIVSILLVALAAFALRAGLTRADSSSAHTLVSSTGSVHHAETNPQDVDASAQSIYLPHVVGIPGDAPTVTPSPMPSPTPTPKPPTVDWTPDIIQETMLIGSSRLLPFSFTVDEDLADVQLVINGPATDLLGLPVSTLAMITTSLENELVVAINVPNATNIGQYTATVRLFAGDEPVGDSLDIEVDVVVPDPESIIDDITMPSADRITFDDDGYKLISDELVVMLDLGVESPDEVIKEIAQTTDGRIIGSVPETLSYQIRYKVASLGELESIRLEVSELSDVWASAFHYSLAWNIEPQIHKSTAGTSPNQLRSISLSDAGANLAEIIGGSISPLRLDAADNSSTHANSENTSQHEFPWNLEQIGVSTVWEVQENTGSSQVKLAIFDLFFDATHPDISVNLHKYEKGPWHWGYAKFTEAPEYFHGTHVAGTACAANGTTGVAQNCWLQLYELGSEFALSIQHRMGQAVEDGAFIVNMSLGSESTECNETVVAMGNLPISRQIHIALEKEKSDSSYDGTLWVVGAGNLGIDAKCAAIASLTSNPTLAPNVISVAAMSEGDRSRLWGSTGAASNFGRLVTVAAPGENIPSTVPDGGYATWSGTSMAAPHVAGLAALVKSAHPDFTAAQVKQCIVTAAQWYGQKITKAGDGSELETPIYAITAPEAVKCQLACVPAALSANAASSDDVCLPNEELIEVQTGEHIPFLAGEPVPSDVIPGNVFRPYQPYSKYIVSHNHSDHDVLASLMFKLTDATGVVTQEWGPHDVMLQPGERRSVWFASTPQTGTYTFTGSITYGDVTVEAQTPLEIAGERWPMQVVEPWIFSCSKEGAFVEFRNDFPSPSAEVDEGCIEFEVQGLDNRTHTFLFKAVNSNDGSEYIREWEFTMPEDQQQFLFHPRLALGISSLEYGRWDFDLFIDDVSYAAGEFFVTIGGGVSQ